MDSRWRATDFPAGKADLVREIAPAELAALERALAAARESGRALESVTRDDFPLGAAANLVASIRREVLDGRGIVIARGFPVERYDVDDLGLLFWGLGAHLGRAVSQSLMGDRLGHVVDVSGTNPDERGYRSRKALGFHTDSDDIVAMLCIRSAREGGVNRFVSAPTIYRDLEREHPDLLPVLERGFRYHWRGEQAKGEPPITEYRVPVLSRRDDHVSCVYLERFIDLAAEALGEPLTGRERRALDAFTEIAWRAENVLELSLEPGEAFFIDNLALLHGRTAFVDHEAPARRRHLLRLWLKADDARPTHEAIRRFYRVDGIDARPGGRTIYAPGT